jgi:hypothetical protein
MIAPIIPVIKYPIHSAPILIHGTKGIIT